MAKQTAVLAVPADVHVAIVARGEIWSVASMTPTPESVKRYPLEWPLGWKRKASYQRRNGRFKHGGNWINTMHATNRLEEEITRIGGKDPVLSTNVTLNMRGVPRGDENPSDPGVALYFLFKKRPTVLACDSYYRVADNIAAIAAHIAALRDIERYGVGTIEQALAGYKALPADTAADWRVVLFGANLPQPVTEQAVDSAYKALARERHPDVTKDDGAAMAHLNRARDYALQELSA